ncbi:class I SAM-dependent methyltransferase [Laspinema olomoucense]|uniref:Class I SAM-dependent methyltransferase n=1 Tax=Laspinema olomoucense D3b TaxID=2953688 RepID=A0ABT2N912_9CYAN|nr:MULTISPECIES: class I SAM-dependent methyltransferase [unclassified Laspinema]MCT7972719.1 class I SAM-dependent methyltransferase [Laspinema sp. D3d]MCT7978225.1 class I SAM-dependent methyltransferase [Laspinema sp. D3b]MCT7988298.1 class I SAM-dependent methyltransferase [Laspinema sp. D3a]
MKFYSQVILPKLMDITMSDPRISQYREEVLSSVSGNVLEIGFGTGLNLPHYPETVQKLTTVDPNPGMNQLAQNRIESSNIDVEVRVISGENLPFPDESFDSVVSTWTLCSIAQVERALAEIHRVLKSTGKFFFLEHGLSEELKIQGWQNILTPLQKMVGDGCHLNRPIQSLVENQFQILELERFYAPKIPKTVGYFYKGVAVKG